LKSLLEKKCHKCFFLQDEICVLSRIRFLPCHMKVKRIRGVDNLEFYVNMVNAKNLSIRSFYFSLAAFFISSMILLLKLYAP
jgi:hypothetical protein